MQSSLGKEQIRQASVTAMLHVFYIVTFYFETGRESLDPKPQLFLFHSSSGTASKYCTKKVQSNFYKTYTDTVGHQRASVLRRAVSVTTEEEFDDFFFHSFGPSELSIKARCPY